MTLENYQALFKMFLALTIVFFVLSIVFFFVFDIRKIFSIKTGRAVRKSVQELNEINRNEDNRKRKKYKGHSMQLSKELTGDFDKATGEITGNSERTGDIENTSAVTAQLNNTETVLLKSIDDSTTVLDVRPETEVLIEPKKVIGENNSEKKSVVSEELSKEKRVFNIIDKKVIVFSKEII